MISIIKKLRIEEASPHARPIIMAKIIPTLIFCITAILVKREDDNTRIPMERIGEKSMLLKRKNFIPLNIYRYGSHNEESTRAIAVF